MGNSFQPSTDLRRDLRRLKGRDQRGGMVRQWDAGSRSFREPTVAPDPILGLYVARQNLRTSAAMAQRYGELRQRVVSPVCLPSDRPSLSQLIANVELARDAFRWAA